MQYYSEREFLDYKLCNRAAENIMELAETYRSLYSLRYVSITWVQVVFSAGTIFILSAVQATSGSRLAHVSLTHSLSQVDLCIQYLTETGRSWNCANNIAGILKNLRKEQLIPRLNMRSIDESRISSSSRKGIGLSLQSQISEDVKPPLTASSADSSSVATMDDDIPSVTSSPPTDISNLSASLRPDWDIGGSSIPLVWNDPMSGISSQQWGADLSYNYMGEMSGMDILRHDFGGFPGLTGGETLPTQPFMSFGIPGPSGADGDYYQQQYGFSLEQHPRQLTEEDVEALNHFLTHQHHNG